MDSIEEQTISSDPTKSRSHHVRNLPLEAVSEDSHLMPIIIYQVCCYPNDARSHKIDHYIISSNH